MAMHTEGNLRLAEVTSRMKGYLAAAQRVKELKDELYKAERHCEDVTKALDALVEPHAKAAIVAKYPTIREGALGVLTVTQESDRQFRVTVGCYDEDDPWPRTTIQVMLNLSDEEAMTV